VLTVDVFGAEGEFAGDLRVGDTTCLGLSYPARIQPLDVPTEPGQLSVVVPGDYTLKLLPVCMPEVRLWTTAGVPFDGDVLVYGDIDGVPTWSGPGPHPLRARCGAVLDLLDTARHAWAHARVDAGDMDVFLATDDLPCTDVAVVDPAGHPIPDLETQRRITGPGHIEVCTARDIEPVAVSSEGAAHVVAQVDMSNPEVLVVLPPGRSLDVRCLDQGGEPCRVPDFACRGEQPPTMQPGSVRVVPDCEEQGSGRWHCTCSPDTALWCRPTPDSTWSVCEEDGAGRADCAPAGRSARLTLLPSNGVALARTSWIPDEGTPTTSMTGGVLAGLLPGAGTWFAYSTSGQASERATLVAGDDVTMAVRLRSWKMVSAACPQPVRASWWSTDVLVGTLDVPPDGTVPAPDLAVPLDGRISCMDGSEEAMHLGP